MSWDSLGYAAVTNPWRTSSVSQQSMISLSQSVSTVGWPRTLVHRGTRRPRLTIRKLHQLGHVAFWVTMAENRVTHGSKALT